MNSQLDLKYFRDAITHLIDKLLPFIEQRSIQSFCKDLRVKLNDERMTPLAIYLETQKTFDNDSDGSPFIKLDKKQSFDYSVLGKIKLAQSEFKNNTQQFASIYNSITENVRSIYMSLEELKKARNQSKIVENEMRQDKIRRVSIYKQSDNNKQVKEEYYFNTNFNKNTDISLSDSKNSSLNCSNQASTKKQTTLTSSPAIQYQPPTQLKSPQISQNNISINTSPQISYNNLQSPNQNQLQRVKVDSGFNQNSQRFQTQTQQFSYIQETQAQPKLLPLQTQNAYVPNYDLLAKVDSLLQKSKPTSIIGSGSQIYKV